MYEHQCKKCNEEGKYIKNPFDVVAKTFYKLKGETLLCYRHWHQSDRPKPEKFGSYGEIVDMIKAEKLSKTRKKY